MTIVDRRRYWLMALGEESRLWDSCHAEGVVRMGGDDVGDLRRYESKAQLKKQGHGLQRVLPSFPLHSLIRYVNALTELLHISVPTRQHLLKATFREGRRTFTGPVDRKQISTRPHDRRRSVEAILRENPVYAQRQVQRRVPFLVANGIRAAPACLRARSHFGVRRDSPPTFRAQAIRSVSTRPP